MSTATAAPVVAGRAPVQVWNQNYRSQRGTAQPAGARRNNASPQLVRPRLHPPASGQRPFKPNRPKPEPKTLFQQYFKSVGPRTYAAQVKEAGNGNQFLVLTEGKRDAKTGEVRKTRLLVFSEDFEAFKSLLRDALKFIAEHPLSPELKKKRELYWKKAKTGNARSTPGSRD